MGEWIDFPREGNNSSYHYARRQWNLVRDPLLRYQHLKNWDQSMLQLEEQFHWLSSEQAYLSLTHEADMISVFERSNLLWCFNFLPTKSYSDYRVPTLRPGKYQIVLNSDEKEFGGHARLDSRTEFFTSPTHLNNIQNSMLVYLPSRCVVIFVKVD